MCSSDLITRDVVERAIRHSLCFGIYQRDAQVGFARMITDHATYAYLADVFVVEAHRGRGLSKWMMECVLAHPDLQGLRRLTLATRDAHGLYARFGFAPPKNPAVWMEIHRPGMYDVSPTGRPATPQEAAADGGCGGERGASSTVADVPPHLNTETTA